MDDTDPEAGAQERTVAPTPGHSIGEYVGTQAPHVIAAVVVDDEKPAPWSEQACRVGDERRAWRGQVRPEDDDRIRAALRQSRETSEQLDEHLFRGGHLDGGDSRAELLQLPRPLPAAAVEDHDLLPDHRPELLECGRDLALTVDDARERFVERRAWHLHRQVRHLALLGVGLDRNHDALAGPQLHLYGFAQPLRREHAGPPAPRPA